MKYKVLFADDNPLTLQGLKLQLKAHLDIEPKLVSTAKEAIELVRKKPADFAAVVLDYHFEEEDTNGAEVARQLFEINKKLSIVISTGDNSTEPPIQSLKAKVSDFVSKDDPDALITSIRNCFPYYDQVLRTFNFEGRHIKERLIENESLISKMGMIGCSDHLRSICEKIERIKNKDTTILVRGESGTGKELVAKAIHEQSDRNRFKFVAINCAAISSNLLESELFGHDKGAFTGADKKRQGKFEIADHGTLFLDEIGEMNIELQAKLLRVLQEKEFYPVGSPKPVKVNVRVVAATNVDLLRAVQEGKFREDLYFRLNIIPIELAPLRYRKEDIEPLASYFKELYGEGREIKYKTFELLKNYDWPGNIRELRNTMEKLFALSTENIVGPEELSEKFFNKTNQALNSYDCAYDAFMMGIREYAERQESDYLLSKLRQLGSVRALSKHTGIPRTTLQRKLKSMGFNAETPTQIKNVETL